MYVYDSWIKDAFENSIKITDKGIIINVYVIIEKEDDLYSAHCLEFDLVGEGETIDQAQESIIDNIINHITFAISKGLYDKIIDPAPPEYWNKLLHSKFLKSITIPPEKKISKERNQIPFLSDLSGKIDSYQCCYA